MQAVSKARREVDEIQDEFFSNALTADTFDKTLKASQAIYDSMENELFLLAAKANDKRLYAMVYCARHAILKAVDSGIDSFKYEGKEAAAEDIRYSLADELDDLRDKLKNYLINLQFHKSSMRKFGTSYNSGDSKELNEP